MEALAISKRLPDRGVERLAGQQIFKGFGRRRIGSEPGGLPSFEGQRQGGRLEHPGLDIIRLAIASAHEHNG